MLSSASDKAKLFAENFCRNSNLDDPGISLPVFHSRTTLKLHNISVTPKMVKEVIINLDLSKTSDPDCIPVVFLKSCEPERSYILAALLSVLRSLVFQIAGRFSQWSLYLSMLGKGLQLKTTTLLKKLVNNRIIDHLEKCGLFSDFQYGFRSFQSTADLLKVVSDRIARVFNRSGATQPVALDISKAFDRV